MSSLLMSILDDWKTLIGWLIIFSLAFSALAKWMPCNPGQPLWRKDLSTDIIYAFVTPVLNLFVRIAFLTIGAFIIFYGTEATTIVGYFKYGFGPMAAMPIWWQAAVVFIVSDIMLYWLHRLFHGKTLWRFHAIHHSPPDVDWLSTYRFHPVNSWLAFVLVDSIMLLVGFSPAAIAALANFNVIYSAMVHANLNWTFGPFKYLFASPVFHRWHHTSQEEGMDKNFAPTFPLLDIIFGTFYMPEGKLPERFGVPGSNIPSDFMGQIIWPFKQGRR